MLLFGIWCCQCEGLMLRQRKLVLGLFVGFFCLFLGKLCPQLGKGYFLFLSLPSILLGPAKEGALFCVTSSGAFWGTKTVVLPCKSSTDSIIWFFDSLFSVIMQIILSFVFAGDLSASSIGVAALTSILCLSKRSIRLNLSWKYSRYSSRVPLELSLPVESSRMLMSAFMSLA